MVSPVRVQMMMVSMKVPVMEMRPCSAGHFVLAAAADRSGTKAGFVGEYASGNTASWQGITPAPAKPPAAAVPVNALEMDGLQ